MHVYLSPHHDDVCFSIGLRASRLGGDLVNLFTRSRWVAAKMDLPADDDARIDVVSRRRREEDQRFASAAGLVRHDLGLREAPLVGHGPFDLADLDADVSALSASLLPYLLAMLPSDSSPDAASLYCPMGIGGHRDHVATLLAVRDAYDALRHRCTLFLYEDLHYASALRARDAGLKRAGEIFAGSRLRPIVDALGPQDAQRKMQWIGFYASQHPDPPRAEAFAPASGMAAGLHEIVWQVSPPESVQT